MFAKIRTTLSIVGLLSILAACSAQSPSPATPPTDLPTAARTDVPSTPQSTPTSQTDSRFDCQNVGDIPVEECQALVALYHSTDGEDWRDSSGWLVAETPCTWSGVICRQGHVFELQLYGNGLAGALPPEIGNLPRLQVLNLSFNQLTGPIPAELGSLANLYGLHLSQNQLSGSIPAELGDLHNLHWLDLSHNRLSGSIPTELENVAVLYWLDVSYNQLTGAVSTGLTKALREDLRLWGNLLDGTVPASEEPVTTVEFQGAEFDFPSSMAESVWPEIRAALPPSEGGAWVSPEHIRFTFADRSKPDTFRLHGVGGPQILIYPAGEYSTMSEIAKGQIEALQVLMDARPPAPEGEIPFLPLVNAGQVFHAQVQYLEFQNGSGVRFLTHYSQEVVGRLTKENVFYTFQGLTRDGKYYVAALFPITSPGLRDEMLEEPWDVAQARLAEDIQHLDSLSSQAFEPDLEVLDRIIESLAVHTP